MSCDFRLGAAASAVRASVVVLLLGGMPAAHAALGSSNLLSQQTSVVADSIKKEAELCATGNTPGTIGNAIQNALKIHTELASAMPNTEALFSPSGDCFSSLLGTWDLSFAIPSLSSVRDAVANALVKFAKKKVCSAVDQARMMTTSSINQAIYGLSSGTGMGGIGDLNGLSNGLMSGALATIDPNLGSQYSKPPAQTDYDVNLNPFSGTPLDFGGSGSSGSSGSPGAGLDSSGALGQISTGNSQINNVNSQLANLQAQVGPAQQAVSQAQSRLSSCLSQTYNNCSNYQSALQNAQAQLNGLNSSIGALKGQLSGYSASSVPSASPASSTGSSVIDRLGSLFN
ncbi:hypothetical protein [Bordetella flabilis]|uniref:Uncharacterized protein n=1 Tax=Bordetella flabilis TaxID=463014 RepID=A0A193GLZ6_9BORD|nr:hypothetical protein [Bordetella flabilis]ANN80890.1 hypothetical protein BAU07_26595 [Bordetella flabilis]